MSADIPEDDKARCSSWQLLSIPELYNRNSDEEPREARYLVLQATTREAALAEARPHVIERRRDDRLYGYDQPFEHFLVVDVAADLMFDESIVAELEAAWAAERARVAIGVEQRRQARERAEYERLHAIYGR